MSDDLILRSELDPKNLFPRDAVSMETYKKLWDAATDRLAACICSHEAIQHVLTGGRDLSCVQMHEVRGTTWRYGNGVTLVSDDLVAPDFLTQLREAREAATPRPWGLGTVPNLAVRPRWLRLRESWSRHEPSAEAG